MISVIIAFFNMYNDVDIRMMFKFLERNYPVSRVKYKMRFRRAIVLDDGSTYILSDESAQTQLMFRLFDILNQVFNCDEVTTRLVLNSFLRLD